MTSKILSQIEREEKYIKEIEELVKKISRDDMRLGQHNVVVDFSKFWVKLEDERLKTLLEKQRIQVEEAIKSWIDLQIEKR